MKVAPSAQRIIMRKRIVIVSFVSTLVIGVAASAFYFYSLTGIREGVELSRENPSDDSLIEPVEETLDVSNRQSHESLSVPPPPPPIAEASTPPYIPEPPRTLLGTTSERLRSVERYLPEGARVALYPVNNRYLRAAIAEADLIGDSNVEAVIVHTTQPASAGDPTPQLTLSVLAHEGERLRILSSTRLTEGGVLFNIDAGASGAPLIIEDVTGDARPEVIVASGIGASLGGAIQVFLVDGLSLRGIANVSGNYFELRGESGSRRIITARGREEDNTRTYRWNGQGFEQVRD